MSPASTKPSAGSVTVLVSRSSRLDHVDEGDGRGRTAGVAHGGGVRQIVETALVEGFVDDHGHDLELDPIVVVLDPVRGVGDIAEVPRDVVVIGVGVGIARGAGCADGGQARAREIGADGDHPAS